MERAKGLPKIEGSTEMIKLNDNEAKAMRAICQDCDEIDGYGFTRISNMCEAVAIAFDRNYHKAGGYISALLDKNLIDMCVIDDEVWVAPDVFEQFC